jgi:hypothetical protein
MQSIPNSPLSHSQDQRSPADRTAGVADAPQTGDASDDDRAPLSSSGHQDDGFMGLVTYL